MSEIKVKFLKEEFSIPECLSQYVKYLQYFQIVYDDMLSLVMQRMRTVKDIGEIISCDKGQEPYINLMNKKADECIAMLADLGIYNATRREFVDYNNGYIRMKRVFEEATSEWKNIMLQAIDDMLSGQETAYRSAASNITGSGVSLYSNSGAALLIHNAWETSVLLQQARQADKEYASSINAVCNRASDNKDRNEKKMLATLFYPGMQNALKLWSSELATVFLEKLDKNGKFDIDAVNVYDAERSSDLLRNVSMVNDKEAVLKEAFKCCPFNADIYATLLEMGICDVETFTTAKYLHLDNMLKTKVESYCKENLDNQEKIVPALDVFALYNEMDKKNALKYFYKDRLNQIATHYSEMQEALKSDKQFDSWIRKYFGSTVEEILKTNNVETSVSRIVNTGLNNEEYQMLIQNNLMASDAITLQGNDLVNLMDINAEYTEKLISATNDYIAEAKKRRADFETAWKAFDDEVKKYTTEIEKLKEERTKLGLFAFSRKKELTSQINESEERLIKFRKEKEPRYLKERYMNMYR